MWSAQLHKTFPAVPPGEISSSILLFLPRHGFGQITRKNLITGNHNFLFSFITPVRVLILGLSFIGRFRDFLLCNSQYSNLLNLSYEGNLIIRWHGIGWRTVLKTRAYDHKVLVEAFAPHVLVLQLGTKDLVTPSTVETGSAIQDLHFPIALWFILRWSYLWVENFSLAWG